jgi:TPR repeat protein
VRLAAKQGNLGAQFMCGAYLEQGRGVAKGLGLAAHFYQLAMDGEPAEAKEACERLWPSS